MIEQTSIEHLKNTLDIVDTVGSRIELKKSGANFKAVCPFHDEKTPSLVISPSKQIFHCFGCGKGGDSISFVMEYEHLKYIEAIEKLATEYNIKLHYTDSKINEEKQKDYETLENLNNFFKKELSLNTNATKYLNDRGIYTSSIEKFGIGYAPDSFKTMKFFDTNFYNKQSLLDLGVAVKSEDGNSIYSRFINRITFPIHLQNGNIVGYGGRTITDHPAKYINSPQSKIFNKSRLLYGYNQAKSNIAKEKQMIITEGYLDVIMLHQVGFTNAVATLGTALTSEHVPLIKRLNPFVILAYDGDDAGIAAALKASKILSSAKINGAVVLFENGKDPADMVKNNELNHLKDLLDNATPIIDFVLKSIVHAYDINDPIQKQNAFNEASSYLRTLSPLLQDEYKNFLAGLLNINSKLIHTNQASQKNFNTSQIKEDIAELNIIKTLLNNKKLTQSTLDIIDQRVFNSHSYEFEQILQNNLQDPKLQGINIREDLKELDDEMFKNQLCLMLIVFYNKKLKNIVKNQDIQFKEKQFKIRKTKEKIHKLQKKILVPIS